MLAPYRSLPRAIHILCLGTLVNRAGTFLVAFLTLYLSGTLGLGEAFATQAMGVYGVGGVLAAFTGGHLADRIGRRTVMLVSLLGASGILLFFGRLTSPPAILAAILAFSFLGEMYRPAVAAMIADLTEPAQRPAAYGLLYVTVNLGMVVSPILGGFLAERSYRYLFLGDALTSMAYALLLFTTIRETLPARERDAAGEPAPHAPVGEVLAAVLRHRAFLGFCLAVHLVSLVYMQSHSTLPLHLRHLGMGPLDYGRIVAVNAFLIVCFQVPFTSFLARFARERILVASAAFTAAGFGMTALVRGTWPIVATVAIWTVGEMMQSPYLSAVVGDMAPQRWRGTYMGVLTLAFASALTVGAPIGGFVLAHFGPGALWGGAFAVAMAGAALFAVVSPAVRAAGPARPPA
jgi:MFS family permease